jgi:NAD(P)-dependent dehydrogenase (short-subunit alcohol dehydrogenase family)
MTLPHTKNVLVTGAGNRIGRAIAQDLAARGYGVILHANTQFEAAVKLAQEMQNNGLKAWAVKADLLLANDVANLIDQARAACGGALFGLINNASIFHGDSAQDFNRDGWDGHFDVHVRAPCELSRNLALALPEGASGSVVNIIDQRVFKLTPNFFTYTLSKAALATATKTLAQALAPSVRVNGVAPGPVIRNVRQEEADFQRQVAATLLGTGSPPDAIVQAVAYLLEAHTVTGQVLAVDGGQSLIWQTPDVVGIVE